MQMFAMLTRLSSGALQSPKSLEELERKVMDHVKLACPRVEWVGSYAILGPYDYLDLFRAADIHEASKVSALVRTYGHAHTEVWPLTEWERFKTVLREIGGFTRA